LRRETYALPIQKPINAKITRTISAFFMLSSETCYRASFIVRRSSFLRFESSL
jgi:hypothetical protein